MGPALGVTEPVVEEPPPVPVEVSVVVPPLPDELTPPVPASPPLPVTVALELPPVLESPPLPDVAEPPVPGSPPLLDALERPEPPLPSLSLSFRGGALAVFPPHAHTPPNRNPSTP